MTVTILEGNNFLVADGDGNVGAGSEGLYFNDVRYLSRWRLTVDGLPPKLLSTGSGRHATATVFGQLASHTGRGAPGVVTRRELSVTEGSLQERLEIANHDGVSVPLLVRYEFDCDFLDLFEVKSQAFGRPDLVFARSVTPLLTSRDYERGENMYTFATTGDGFAASTLIWFSDRGVPGDREVFFEVELEPHGSWTLTSNLILLSGDGVRRRTYEGDWFVRERDRARVSLERFHASTPVLTSSLPQLEQTYARTVADLAALRMKGGQAAGEELPAAGLPWFMTIFGRDTEIVCLQTLLLGQTLPRAALRTLAALQSTFDDVEKDAEPGKIIHEMRYGKVAALTSSFPYYGSVDSTPLYLMLLGETYRWTADAELARELEPSARRARGWVEGAGDLDGDGYVEFHRRSERGIATQSWKDSHNSMLFADGRLAVSPIAGAEVQGYAYAARLAVALLARSSWGDPSLADRLEEDAATLKARFNRDFWVDTPAGGHFALALDRDKRPVDALTSNIGHLLWTGIVEADKVERTARALLGDDLFSGWGIRTMARSSVGYNPIEYHNGTVWPHDTSIACAGLARAGYHDEALRLFLHLLDAAEHFDWRLPEVMAGFARADTGFPVLYPTSCSPQAWAAGAPVLCLRALLGIEPDPTTRSLTARETVALPGLDLRLDGVPAFDRLFDVVVEDARVRIEERASAATGTTLA